MMLLVTESTAPTRKPATSAQIPNPHRMCSKPPPMFTMDHMETTLPRLIRPPASLPLQEEIPTLESQDLLMELD